MTKTALVLVDPNAMLDREVTMDWRSSAECLGEDPELFFPYSRGPSGQLQAETAKAICRRCPVASECLNWALDSTPMPDGIWGGTDEDERADMIRNRDRAAKRRYFRKEWR